MDIEIERAGGYAMPVMKECNSGEWLKEARNRLERLEKLLARKEPAGVEPSIRAKLADDTRRSMLAEARELIAASQILYGEIVNEGEKNGRSTP